MDTKEKSKMQRFSFKALHDHYAVVIPMLQRDYAYGRQDEAEKRDHFLKNLKKYLDGAKPHELDFVYGSVDRDNNLKLLDGQQRMTTLFLLHWYLSLGKDAAGKHNFDHFKKMMQRPVDEKGASKFTYKTRYSSTDFCNILVTMEATAEILEGSAKNAEKEPVVKEIRTTFADQYSDIISDEKAVISEMIKKEKWFLPHWNYDPTICGMLTMLDAIKTVFQADKCAQYYEKLVEKDHLVFNFLNLDDFQLTDELYIKMNSRGRPLTRFENLKSKLLPLYDTAKDKVAERYQQKLAQINCSSERTYRSLREYVSQMLDSKWTDVFWNEWRNTPDRSERPNVDDMMLCFITVLAINCHILYKLAGSLSLPRNSPLAEEINQLMKQKAADKGITLKYDQLVELFEENDYAFLFTLIDYFNMFNNNGALKTYYDPVFERELFSHIANDYKTPKLEYAWKAKAFAYTKYLLENPTPDLQHFQDWMRFVNNVCANSYTLENGADTFGAALAGLNYLYREDIAAELRTIDLSNITVLDASQLNEEVLKSQLSDDPDWESAIKEAENKLPYFDGRLDFILKLCCSVDASAVNDVHVRATFREYVNKMVAIFPTQNGCDRSWEISLIRALLSKGDYLMYFKSSNTFLQNNGRDNSWRRYLKEAPAQSFGDVYRTNAWHPYSTPVCDIRCYFKEVIDDPQFNLTEPEKSLNKIAESRPDDLPMWRKLIIDQPKVLKSIPTESFGTDRFIRWNEEKTEHSMTDQNNYEIDLLHGKNIISRHAELFSLCKYFELQGKTFGAHGAVKYQTAISNQTTPHFYLGKEDTPVVKVFYQDDLCFRFVLADGHEITDIAYADVESRLNSI